MDPTGSDAAGGRAAAVAAMIHPRRKIDLLARAPRAFFSGFSRKIRRALAFSRGETNDVQVGSTIALSRASDGRDVSYPSRPPPSPMRPHRPVASPTLRGPELAGGG